MSKQDKKMNQNKIGDGSKKNNYSSNTQCISIN